MVRRRILAVPLALVVAIAVFISPVLGVPQNTVSGSVLVSFFPSRNTGSFISYDRYVNLGSIQSFGFYNYGHLTYSGITNLSSVSSIPSQYDIFIAVLTDSIPNLQFNSLSSYYYPHRNLSATVSVPAQFTYLDDDSYIDPPTFTTTLSQDITYLCFRGVPNQYSWLIDDYNPATPNGFEDGGVGTILEDGNYYPIFTFGFYMTSSSISSDSIVSDYKNGAVDFNNALNEIEDLVNDSVSAATTPEFKILEVLIGQQQIDDLVRASNDVNLSVIQSSLNPGLESIIDSYVAGSLSLDQAMESMHNQFSSALDTAVTPEQGLLISTNYQLSLDKLEIEAKQKALDKLDSAVSDEQLTEADDYYAAEEDLIDKFELAEFESALDFELWFNTLPPSETALYKQFFDYLLNDSSIRMFLIVPISLILVRILMGTHLVLGRGGDHSSKTTVFDSDDHYHFYDDGFRGS